MTEEDSEAADTLPECDVCGTWMISTMTTRKEDGGYYDKNSEDVAVVVRLLDPRDRRRAGGLAGKHSQSRGYSNTQWVSLPVSHHISLNRPGLQIDPLACNCLEGHERPAHGLMRGKVKREERKKRVMLMTEIKKDAFFKKKKNIRLRERKGVNACHLLGIY